MNAVRSSVGLAFLVLVLFSFWSCATTTGVPRAETMPEGASFSGLWFSPQFQHMYLFEEDGAIRGVYAYQGGGTIEGEVNGNLLLFSWEDPGSREQVRRTMRGMGYLQLIEEEGTYRLVGEWGYNQERRGAGPWTAEFVRPLEEEDPQTLEEIRRVH